MSRLTIEDTKGKYFVTNEKEELIKSTLHFVDKADNSSDYPDLVDIETYDGKAIDLLAEYENLGLTPYELDEMRADAVCLYKENQQLKQRIDELETLQPKFKVGEEFTDTDIMCFLLTKYNLDIEEVKKEIKEVEQ